MGSVKSIQKRNGSVVEFNPNKIAIAIFKAMNAVGEAEESRASQIADEAIRRINIQFADVIPTVENVQDIVEKTLIDMGFTDAAKAYIIYRQRRSEIREVKTFLGVQDDLKLGINAVTVLQRRYLMKDDQGKVIETPKQMFSRVAKAIALADLRYDRKANIQEIENEFYQVMRNQEFIPNSPALMNAGTRLGQLSACFVLPIEDSIDGIFTSLKYMAKVHQTGGGTGFSFSDLRPAGDIVGSTKGVASGPVSFLSIYDAATNVIKQGGRRRGANMAVLNVTHPDIEAFITSKSKEGSLTNFNISVAVTNDFMKAVEEDKEYNLINPRTKGVERSVRARHIFDLIVANAWRSGDPGLLFIDEINRYNPTPNLGRIGSTNPCGEVPLLPFESCNLGSINLQKMVADKQILWEKIRATIKTAVHFLDNVIDVNTYSILEIEQMTKANRKIGLGVMGFADLLIELGIPYNSEDALALAERLMKFIKEEATKQSVELSKKRGSFPNFKESQWEKQGYDSIRNATVTTIAPTGTISIIAECSSGIEPIFAVVYVRNVLEGTRLLDIHPGFEQMAKDRGIYSKELMMEIAKTGSLKNVKGIPEEIKRVVVTAHDISPEWHVRMQAAFQKYVDNAVSKTVNLPYEATMDDVRRIYWLAYNLRCKGITVYRYGSKPEQVLNVGSPASKELDAQPYVVVDSEYSTGCSTGTCPF